MRCICIQLNKDVDDIRGSIVGQNMHHTKYVSAKRKCTETYKHDIKERNCMMFVAYT